MKISYLFPNKFKNIGWFIFIPSALIGCITFVFEVELSALDFNFFAVFIEQLLGDRYFSGFVNNNILNEIFGILTIMSSILVAFSKEKLEDEYISKIRLEFLVWSVYLNYAIFIFIIVYNGKYRKYLHDFYTMLWFVFTLSSSGQHF